jgi:coenzyme F420-reducing hydrogenase gamma subunit
VVVDLELSGCPVNEDQSLDVLITLLMGNTPHLPRGSGCLECPRRGISGVMVRQGIFCRGPVTQARCGALCPAYYRVCFGCFDPTGSSNPDSFSNYLRKNGTPRAELIWMLRGFAGYVEAFRSAGDKLGKVAV